MRLPWDGGMSERRVLETMYTGESVVAEKAAAGGRERRVPVEAFVDRVMEFVERRQPIFD